VVHRSPLADRPGQRAMMTSRCSGPRAQGRLCGICMRRSWHRHDQRLSESHIINQSGPGRCLWPPRGPGTHPGEEVVLQLLRGREDLDVRHGGDGQLEGVGCACGRGFGGRGGVGEEVSAERRAVRAAVLAGGRASDRDRAGEGNAARVRGLTALWGGAANVQSGLQDRGCRLGVQAWALYACSG
jgi:hypothetical protein